MLELDTYTPDKGRDAFGEKLADYTSMKELPSRFLGKDVTRLVKEIDVIWFKNEFPLYAFEVEHTTKFGTGFQRLMQLQPLATKLYIVSAQKNFYLFEKFINSDPYYKHKNDFHFRNYKQLEDYFNSSSEFSVVNDVFLDKK